MVAARLYQYRNFKNTPPLCVIKSRIHFLGSVWKANGPQIIQLGRALGSFRAALVGQRRKHLFRRPKLFQF